MVVAAVVISMASAPLGPAAAAHRHGHRPVSHAKGRVRPSAPFVHSDLAPLVNTTWDSPQMPAAVATAILTAASATGVDPNLLAALAWRESRFDPTARNRWSSATGLLQFTTATWLQAVKAFGAQHDAAAYAGQIAKDRHGILAVADKRARAAIMQLRSDPAFSAALAADTIRQQREGMAQRLGRAVAIADLYLLHVLGVSGSARFLEAAAQHPSASSQSVASHRILRQAGLLARDGRPMTVGNTYAAVEVMLAEQRLHSAPLLAPLEVSEAP